MQNYSMMELLNESFYEIKLRVEIYKHIVSCLGLCNSKYAMRLFYEIENVHIELLGA